jgi:hypothetical protein
MSESTPRKRTGAGRGAGAIVLFCGLLRGPQIVH